MANETTQNEKVAATPAKAPVASAPASTPDSGRGGFRGGFGGQGGRGGGDRKDFRKNPRKGGSREPRAKPEFDQKIINIRRVTRVSAGGKRFQFSVAMIAGNRRGSVGVGLGKGGDTAIAIDKAFRNARRNIIALKLTADGSLPHDISAKYSSARISIVPAKGRGVIAGSAARHVLELAGVKDINAKLLSPSKNQLNIARATLKALSFFATGPIPEKIQ